MILVQQPQHDQQNLLDLNQQVGDAEGERPRQVDQDKRVHARQQHAAQAWKHAAQTGHGQETPVVNNSVHNQCAGLLTSGQIDGRPSVSLPRPR